MVPTFVSFPQRLLAALGCGALLAFALPTVFPIVGHEELMPGGQLSGLAYVALAPFLLAVDGAKARARFELGVIAALAYYTVAIWWIFIAMHTFGGIPTVISIPILYLLLGYLAVYWGLALMLDHDIRARFPRLPQWLVLPATFVAGELCRNYLFSGFPWANVGYLLARDRPAAQWASLFGVYGLAFVVLLANAALAAIWRQGFQLGAARGATAAFAAAVLVPRLYGYWHLAALDREMAAAPTIQVALIQGNVDQKIKNAAKGGLMGFQEYRDFVLGRYLPLTRQADAEGVDLIVWPEASFPGALPLRPETFPDVLGPPLRAQLVLGGVSAGRQDGRILLTNSAFALDGQRRVVGQYDKHHLVPFGEYVPLEKTLHLPIHKVVPDIGFFDPGETLDLITVPRAGGASARYGPMICFDAIFPEIGVGIAREDPDLLLNLTNDAWYGFSSAAYQFLSIVALRAIETGRPVARAANTGISAFIDPSGRILQRLPIGLVDTAANDVGVDRAVPPQMLIGALPLLHGRTVYVAIGDSFGYLCGLLTLGLWIWAKRAPRRV